MKRNSGFPRPPSLTPLPTNHHVAEGILPAVEGRHPAARTCCHPFLRVDCLDAFSAGLEAPALRQAGCLPLQFRGSNREVLFRRILTLILSPEGERRPRFSRASDVSTNQCAKAGASSTHSKRFAWWRRLGICEAFGVRPACWRFGLMRSMREVFLGRILSQT